MKAYLIYNTFEAERNKNYIGFYFEECEKRNIELTLLLEEELTLAVIESKQMLLSNREPLMRPDFIICRTMNPILSWQLEQMNIPVFNNSAVSSICNDKMKTYAYAASLGVRIPDTFYNLDLSVYSPYPLVIKPTCGKGGKNVFMLKSYEDYLSARDALGRQPYVVQHPVSDLGKDLRVYVIGKEIVTAMLRTSYHDFRSNFCLGGEASVYDLHDAERAIIQKVIDGFDFGFVGIDFMFHNYQLVLNEIEDVVGARMVYSKTDINIVGKYLDHILSWMKAHHPF